MPTQDASQSAESAVPSLGVVDTFRDIDTESLNAIHTDTRAEIKRLESELKIAEATEIIFYELLRSRDDWIPF